MQRSVKRSVIILLAFIYALSTTGFALKADYCCEKLQSVKLVLAEKAKDKDGCCKVKYQSLKVNDMHATTDVVTAPALPFTFIHTRLFVPDYTYTAFSQNNTTGGMHTPPVISTAPVYIANCVFRI